MKFHLPDKSKILTFGPRSFRRKYDVVKEFYPWQPDPAAQLVFRGLRSVCALGALSSCEDDALPSKPALFIVGEPSNPPIFLGQVLKKFEPHLKDLSIETRVRREFWIA